MRFLKKEVEGNTKKIEYLDRRMDDFKGNVTRRFEKLEYRVKKIEKIGLGKFGRIMSKVGKGIEKIFGGVKDGVTDIIDAVGDNVAKAEDHGGDALATALTPLMIGGMAIACAVMVAGGIAMACLLYTSPSPRDRG